MSIFGMLGCSNNSALTRSKAEQVIKGQIKYPKDILGVCATKRAAGNAPQYAAYVAGYRAYFEQLQAQGLLRYTTGTATQGPNDTLTTFTATLTDKGQSFVVGPAENVDRNAYSQFLTVKTGQLEFGEITGIVERKESSTAEVHYTEKVVETPFGTALGVAKGPYVRTATFTKYDDGWRLNSATQ
jgi:hypothetical protein